MLEKTFYKSFLSKSFSIPVEITFWDDSKVVYGDGEPELSIIFHEPVPIRELTRNASIALGEAYMDKKIEIKGDIQKLVYSAYQNADSFMRSSKLRKFLPKQSHSKKASKSDIQSHYDLGNDFYKLWLDDTMTYSCAYFDPQTNPENDLEKAQIDKVHHIIEKLNPQKGSSLLDIGCGWGTLMLTAAKKYGLKVTGITLSQEQYNHVTQRIKDEHLEDVAEVYLTDYRDMGDRTWDYVTSVGMFEHVGKENLSLYFETINRYLKKDGLALIHGITRQQGGAYNGWINKYIFPGGYIPGLTEIIGDITNANLQITDTEMLRRHYQKTLEIWAKNFNNVLDQVQLGERFIRMWDMYLQACAASFQAGNIDVVQYLLSKGASGDRLPMTRDYMLK